MALNMRVSSSDPRPYHPGRDLAWNFGEVVNLALRRCLSQRAWPELQAMLKREGVTEDDLNEAYRAFAEFVCESAKDPSKDMKACLDEAGWDLAPAAAQIGFLACIGTVMAGYYWSGVREVTLNGVGPADGFHDLRDAGEKAARLMQAPRWWRNGHRWLRRTANLLFFRL